MRYYYNDIKERVEYNGDVIHAIEIDMEPKPVKLRFNSEAAAYSVLSAVLDNMPIGFLSIAHLIEAEDGRPLYEE